MRTFTLLGNPTGKGRARMTRNGHAFTPEKTRAYEKSLRLAYLEAVKGQPYEKGVPLKMSVYCGYPIPKSDSKKNRLNKICGLTKPTVKPDLSNCLKAIEDALNEVAYYDDAQITTITITKRYDTEPGVRVSLEMDV